jgi:micrococcal nuclease
MQRPSSFGLPCAPAIDGVSLLEGVARPHTVANSIAPATHTKIIMTTLTLRFFLSAMMMMMIMVIPPEPAYAFVTLDQIERVVDGDTVIAKSAGRLRMIGMNTPETVSSRQTEQGAPPDCYGPEASAYTKKLLPAGTSVRLETDQESRDKYGRNLVYIFRSSDNIFINGELVKQGYARQRTYGKNIKYDGLLRGYEQEAQTARRGLWNKCMAKDSTAKNNLSIQQSNPGDIKNCKDFEDYREAKAWYDTYSQLYGDVARLDGDGDGVPCESLSGAPKKNKL